MRNFTQHAVVIEHPFRHVTLVERAKHRLNVPKLYEDAKTTIPVGTKQHPVPIRRMRECPPDERERINADLRREINNDRDETGDGIVLVDAEILPLIDHDLRNSVFAPKLRATSRRPSTVAQSLIGIGERP